MTLIEIMTIIAYFAVSIIVLIPPLKSIQSVANKRAKNFNIKIIEDAIDCYLAANPDKQPKDIDDLEIIVGFLHKNYNAADNFEVNGQVISIKDGRVSYIDSK